MSIVYYGICLICNSKAPIAEDPRYDGLRGTCHKCENNWPES